MNDECIIKISIDSIEKVEGKIKVSGWGYDAVKNCPIDLLILGEESVGIQLKRRYRTDVNHRFKIDLEEKLGFEIYFDKRWENKSVHLKFYTDDESITKKIKFKKGRVGAKKLKKYPLHWGEIVKKVKVGTRYLGNNGFRRTLKRFLEEFYFKQARDYKIWIGMYESEDPSLIAQKLESFKIKPKISILLPVYNTPEELLIECLNSVKSQSYTHWELCIADDNSSLPCVKKVIDDFAREDTRVKVVYRSENGHISKASNTALEMATGDYVTLLDHDDQFTANALYKIVEAINDETHPDFIYSDEDKINKIGKRTEPFFKPDWSPDTILCQNYICHLVAIKKTLIEKAGGFRVGFEGAQDYDLVLRCTELAESIYHIPLVLYHWRMIENSTADNPEAKLYAFEAGKRAIESALERRKIKGRVEMREIPGIYRVNYKLLERPLISVIIPTKDHPKDLEKCIASILEKTSYENYEILVVDNGSTDPETFKLFEKYESELKEKFRVLRLDIPFNYSELNNRGVEETRGEYILLLNNDIQIISKGWMTRMLEFAQQDHIGAVGGKLYYADHTIQHSGVIVGLGGVAGHSHKFYKAKSGGYFNRLFIDANYSAVTAACLMVKKEKYLEVGGLNEKDLAIAFNDVDFCLKLLDRGYSNLCLSDVECYHHESKSRGKEDTTEKVARFNKEIEYMKETWKKNIAHDPYYSQNLTLSKEDFSIRVE